MIAALVADVSHGGAGSAEWEADHFLVPLPRVLVPLSKNQNAVAVAEEAVIFADGLRADGAQTSAFIDADNRVGYSFCITP